MLEQPQSDATQSIQHKNVFYKELYAQAASLIDPVLPLVSNLSNIAALIYWAFHDPAVCRPVNWVGFYLVTASKPNTLVLGPFQGKIACTQIKIGKGVCGTSASERRSIVVPDIHTFPGHIACDSASQSELVVPIMDPTSNICVGVLDLDSTSLNGFDQEDRSGLENIVELLVERLSTHSSWQL